MQDAIEFTIDNVINGDIRTFFDNKNTIERTEVICYIPAASKYLQECQTLEDLEQLTIFTENVVTMLRAKESDNTTFFEILHDLAVFISSGFTESCDVLETYGWEMFF